MDEYFLRDQLVIKSVFQPLTQFRRLRTVTVVLGLFLFLAACGGGGGDSSDAASTAGSTTTPVPSASSTTSLSGKATFQMVPHDRFTNGLVYQFTFSKPIRGAVVELVSSSGATLASTLTDEDGNYRFPASPTQQVSIRVKAQMRRSGSPSWDVSVVDNVNNDALYTLTSGGFSLQGATMVRDLEASSGWTGREYGEVRAAGPFAILDTVYDSMQTVLQANPVINFPELELNWSVDNRPTSGSFADGEIGSSLFRPSGGGREIFIVGAADADTDEYDPHVIAHEFTHYLHFHFGRSDSLGGSHSIGDRLDPRVAFGEGLASAYAAIVLDDSNYIDTLGFGQAAGVNFDIENNDLRNPGWYNEGSVQAIIYDLFDAEMDGADSLSLGFIPVYEALVGKLRTEVPFVTIHAYLDALKQDYPAIVDRIDDVAAIHGVRTVDSDAYAVGETNSARRFDKVLPLYTDLPTDGSVITLCTIAGSLAFGTRNKLSNRRFMRVSIVDALASQTIAITATGPTGSDPELILHQAGVVQSSLGNLNGTETMRRVFNPGDYILEVYEYTNTTDDPLGDVCFEVSASYE